VLELSPHQINHKQRTFYGIKISSTFQLTYTTKVINKGSRKNDNSQLLRNFTEPNLIIMNSCFDYAFYASVCAKSNPKYFPAKSTIFHEGSSLKGVYCIESGVCKILKLSENGDEQIIQLLGKRTLLGIRSVVNDECTNLKAQTLTAVSAQFVPIKDIKRTINKNPLFCSFLLQNFAKQIKDADNRIVSMGQHRLGERLASLLLYIKKEFGLNPDGSLKVYLKRAEMANFIGTATESMIRTLKRFEITDG